MGLLDAVGRVALGSVAGRRAESRCGAVERSAARRVAACDATVGTCHEHHDPEATCCNPRCPFGSRSSREHRSPHTAHVLDSWRKCFWSIICRDFEAQTGCSTHGCDENAAVYAKIHAVLQYQNVTFCRLCTARPSLSPPACRSLLSAPQTGRPLHTRCGRVAPECCRNRDHPLAIAN